MWHCEGASPKKGGASFIESWWGSTFHEKKTEAGGWLCGCGCALPGEMHMCFVCVCFFFVCVCETPSLNRPQKLGLANCQLWKRITCTHLFCQSLWQPCPFRFLILSVPLSVCLSGNLFVCLCCQHLLSFFFSLSLSLFCSLSPSLSLSLSFSLFIYIYISLSLFLSLSLS